MTKRHTTVCRLVVAQFRAMSLLFSCCSSADEPRIKKAAGICALRPTGPKMHSYENARPPAPGASKTEPKLSHWGSRKCSSERGTRGVLRNYDSIKSEQLASCA